MSKIIDFELLELIPELLDELKRLRSEVPVLKTALVPELDLTKRVGVLQFLHISESKLKVMMKDGRLKINIHFIREIKGNKTKITFIESGILEFKENTK
ncbi:MAG: hypothetical protein HRT41_07045 [Campylobacteraceae bacterium]|nr:hypothetical protein [Campylobacteraceae bacterium]